MSIFRNLFGGGGGSAPAQTARPERPNILDSNNFVQDQFRLSNHTSPFEQKGADALNQLFDRANSQGPSQSAQYLMQQNNANANAGLGSALKSNASQFQNLVNNQASRGGLDRGSRMRALTRLNDQNQRSSFNTNLNRQNNELDILRRDEDSKFKLLGALPGQARAQTNQDLSKSRFDIQNSLNTANNYYNQDMSQWAALNAANQGRWLAQNTGGLFGSGGFLGTGL